MPTLQVKKFNDLCFHLKKLEKKNEINPKQAERSKY